MKRILFLIICSLLLSCIRDNPKDIPPSSPVDEEEFKEILQELYLIDAFVSNKNQNFHRDSAYLYINAKLQRLGKSLKDFNEAILYYSSKPTFLDSITELIRDTLESKFLEISHDEIENPDTNKTISTVLKNYPYIKTHNVNKNFIFNTSSRDSIINYFSNNPDQLGEYTLEEFLEMMEKQRIEQND